MDPVRSLGDGGSGERKITTESREKLERQRDREPHMQESSMLTVRARPASSFEMDWQ